MKSRRCNMDVTGPRIQRLFLVIVKWGGGGKLQFSTENTILRNTNGNKEHEVPIKKNKQIQVAVERKTQG